MESYFDALFAPAPLVTGGLLILVALLSMILRPTKSFNVPFVGVEERDMSKMKAKYVHEADTLLREGYDKVFDGSLTNVDCSSHFVFLVPSIDFSSHDTRWTAFIPSPKLCK